MSSFTWQDIPASRDLRTELNTRMRGLSHLLQGVNRIDSGYRFSQYAELPITTVPDAPSAGSRLYVVENGPDVEQWVRFSDGTSVLIASTSGGGIIGSLINLSDVASATPTNRNVLVADGTDWHARALTAVDIQSGTFANARISEENVTQHEGALSISYTQMTGTLPQAQVTQHEGALELAASQTTSGQFAEGRISQSSVTQHQAALTINASQVTAGTFGVGTFIFPQGAVRVQHPAGASKIEILADAGFEKLINYVDLSSGNLRWAIKTINAAEPGSNVGTDLAILGRTDAGGPLHTVLRFIRSTGLATFGANLEVLGTLGVGATWVDHPGTSVDQLQVGDYSGSWGILGKVGGGQNFFVSVSDDGSTIGSRTQWNDGTIIQQIGTSTRGRWDIGGLDVTGAISLTGELNLGTGGVNQDGQIGNSGISGTYIRVDSGSSRSFTIFRAGGTSVAVALNPDYHWIPGTNNAQALGVSSLRWSTIYAVNGNFSSSVFVNSFLEVGWSSGSTGHRLEGGTTSLTTYRFDADAWRLHAGGTGGIGEVLRITQAGDGTLQGDFHLIRQGAELTVGTSGGAGVGSWINIAGNFDADRGIRFRRSAFSNTDARIFTDANEDLFLSFDEASLGIRSLFIRSQEETLVRIIGPQSVNERMRLVGTATGSPGLRFYQASTSRGYLEYNNSGPGLRLVSQEAGSSVGIYASGVLELLITSTLTTMNTALNVTGGDIEATNGDVIANV